MTKPSPGQTNCVSREPPAKIQLHDGFDTFYQSVGDEFCELVRRAVDSRGIATIALSGGSTPRRLYELLAQRELPWTRIHWFWGDERNVPPDHPDSNQKMVREALLQRVAVPESHIHAVPVDVDDPAGSAGGYARILRDHFHDQVFPQWDLALLGMGDDAHTASLFPSTDALRNQHDWFTENWVEKLDTFRYTLTVSAINSARNRWFLVAGSNKRDALARVWHGPHNPRQYPSQMIREAQWFVTRDALPHGGTYRSN